MSRSLEQRNRRRVNVGAFGHVRDTPVNTHCNVRVLYKTANELIRRQLGVSFAAAHNL